MKKIMIWTGIIVFSYWAYWITNLIIEVDIVREAKASLEIETKEFRESELAVKKSKDLVELKRKKRETVRILQEKAQSEYQTAVWILRCVEMRKTQIGQEVKENCSKNLERFANFH